MISNLLKRWRDDFATVKRQRDGFGAFRKETGCHPALSRPTSSTAYIINKIIYYKQVLFPRILIVLLNTFE
jgi:hypothetical protein